jgi:hypothetical protein
MYTNIKETILTTFLPYVAFCASGYGSKFGDISTDQQETDQRDTLQSSLKLLDPTWYDIKL